MTGINNYNSCFGKSICSSLKIYFECLKQIHQGEDVYFEFLLVDENGNPLDLNNVLGIYIQIYGDKYRYLTYTYPDTSDSFPIQIIQTVENGEPVDIGIIGIRITAEESSKFMTGSLYAEMKIKIIDTNWQDGYQTKIISCLKIAEVKLSNTTDIINF